MQPCRRRGGIAATLALLSALSLTGGAAAAAAPTTGPVPLAARVSFATCGFPREACAPGTLGQTSKVEPKPQTIGRFVEVGITQWIKKYGADAVAAQPAKPLAGSAIWPTVTPLNGTNGPGFGGNVLPLQFFPSTGTWTVDVQGLNIPFLIPDLGRGVPSALPMAKTITVSVPPAHYLVIWLLETGIFGSQTVPILEHYTDGSSQYVPSTFSDWCNGGAPLVYNPPEYPAIWTPYRLHPNGAKGTNVCGGFYAQFLPVHTSKVMDAITFPNSAPNAFVMAVTLQKAS
jgi:hypothetical protein